MEKTNPEHLGRIGVLMGGYSSEREISLKSGTAVCDALKAYGCRVFPVDIVAQDEETILSLLKESRMDVAFIALHGHLGEDGAIQSILEKISIPYTGSGVEASRVAINKVLTQEILKRNNIPVPRFRVVSKNQKDAAAEAVRDIGLPAVVKPSSQGSSIGITLIEKDSAAPEAFAKAFEYDDQVLVEEYIRGRELTVGILDRQPLPVIEIRPKNIFFDFTAKYQSGGTTEYVIPAELPSEVARDVQAAAFKSHEALGCTDLSRVDVMLNREDKPYVLEINTIPGFTATSLLPKAAKAQGLDFTRLCLRLVELAYKKQKRPQGSAV